MSRGAEFGKILPQTSQGLITTTPNLVVPTADFGLDNGLIHQVSDTNAYRMGQQILFWIGILNTPVGGNSWAQVQIKPYWLRPNNEYRAPGTPTRAPNLEIPPGSGWAPIDDQTFHAGPVVGAPLDNNRYVWIPSPKRLDITEYTTAPPTPSPARNSASEMEDDFWQWNLQDPAVPAYAALFPSPQEISRWSVFMYPAMGYAIGFTANATPTNLQAPLPPTLRVVVSWTTGTLGATNYQESIG